MLRALLPAILAALFVAPAAGAWTWPADGPVLQPFVFDPAHPYARRAAPGHRRRRRSRSRGARAGRGNGHVRGIGPVLGEERHDRDGRRLLGDAHAPRLDHGRQGRRGRRGGSARRDRPERRRRGRTALRAPGHPADRAGAGLSRPAVVPSRPSHRTGTGGDAAPRAGAGAGPRAGRCGGAPVRAGRTGTGNFACASARADGRVQCRARGDRRPGRSRTGGLCRLRRHRRPGTPRPRC